MTRPPALKDERLDQLAEAGNVAQFVSFDAGDEPSVRHLRITGDPAGDWPSPEPAIQALLASSIAGSVNVRSFRPDQGRGNPFHYGLNRVDEAAALVRGLGAQGYLTIVNETVDVQDGGVSGVALGGLLEFAPDDTPRAVEKPGVAALPRPLGLRLLQTVYGFEPDIPAGTGQRLEFSIHPGLVGYRNTHTLWWEIETVDELALTARNAWPNRFSRHLGDKAYGLLMADLLALPVPRSTVIGRRVAPFSFGRATGTGQIWLRTCPTEQAPGRYSTVANWVDPFALLAKEDPQGGAIASVLAQEGVAALWSGATMPAREGNPDFVQGVAGRGDAFMLGEQPPVELPERVSGDVQQLAARARELLGPVRLEWAHDGNIAWVLHCTWAATSSKAGTSSARVSRSAGWTSMSRPASMRSDR